MNVRPAICIVENDKLLVMCYRSGETDVYNLPGGNLEFGEKMNECLERELQEELQIEVEVGEMLCLADVFIEKTQKQTLHTIFRGKIISGVPIPNPVETTTTGIYWLPFEELASVHLYPSIGEQLLKAIQNELSNPFLGRVIQPWI
ncbi:MAG: NUDIX domain-containing protein [Spirosomaceae bacterium]|nr:NUDIX domain-containing protein [Spirosomataceae bacterium]